MATGTVVGRRWWRHRRHRTCIWIVWHSDHSRCRCQCHRCYRQRNGCILWARLRWLRHFYFIFEKILLVFQLFMQPLFFARHCSALAWWCNFLMFWLVCLQLLPGIMALTHTHCSSKISQQIEKNKRRLRRDSNFLLSFTTTDCSPEIWRMCHRTDFKCRRQYWVIIFHTWDRKKEYSRKTKSSRYYVLFSWAISYFTFHLLPESLVCKCDCQNFLLHFLFSISNFNQFSSSDVKFVIEMSKKIFKCWNK